MVQSSWPSFSALSGAPAMPPSDQSGPELGAIDAEADGAPANGPGQVQWWSSSEFAATWLAGGGDAGFGMTDLELCFDFRFPGAAETPCVIAPGFVARLWEGPAGYDMPDQVYDAFVDVSWSPPLSDCWSLHFGASPGLYGDFREFDRRALLVPARAFLMFDWTPRFRMLGGLVFTDRLRPRILPIAGLVWWPSDALVLELLLPRPRVAWRVGTAWGVEWWGYVAGEFSGGNWLVHRPDDTAELVNYSDLRALFGLEASLVGYVFERSLFFDGPTPSLDPDDTLLVRAGVAF